MLIMMIRRCHDAAIAAVSLIYFSSLRFDAAATPLFAVVIFIDINITLAC